ncbi:hypothetical protein [uncultured Maricaulis sp.]|uniref:hypothetical protein n=1 Tax=uncultured Maricaulis sp. TaxID=174710 RepID=UPI0030DA2007|tara:strand:+ start:5284 stop:5748 length:465 start_codon:yes stop_codon:yes gene_type:complete
MKLTRENLAATAVRRFETVTLSNGLEARLQNLGEPEITEFDTVAYDDNGEYKERLAKLRRRKLIQLCVVDEAGVRLYESPEQVKGDGGLLCELFAHCERVTGLDKRVEIKISEAKKNYAQTLDCSTPSESAGNSESPTLSSGSSTPAETLPTTG